MENYKTVDIYEKTQTIAVDDFNGSIVGHHINYEQCFDALSPVRFETKEKKYKIHDLRFAECYKDENGKMLTRYKMKQIAVVDDGESLNLSTLINTLENKVAELHSENCRLYSKVESLDSTIRNLDLFISTIKDSKLFARIFKWKKLLSKAMQQKEKA